MKLEFLSFDFEKFAQEMQNLKDKKGFDYLVTIVGEDFGAEEGLGCVYILENSNTHERCSVKMIAKTDADTYYLPTVSNLWKVADLLEREVYDFFGIVFVGHPDMRRLFLRYDFKGYPFRKDWEMANCSASRISCLAMMTMCSTSALSTQLPTVYSVCRQCSTVRS